MTSNPSNRVSRRALLHGAAAATAAGVAGLTACGPDGGTGGSGGSGGGSGGTFTPPSYVPFPGVEPDQPGTAEGVAPVFYNYPNPPVARDGFPLQGGEPWRALMPALMPKTAPAQNKNFAAYEKAVGSSFELTYVTNAQYKDKFQVTLASGDIPDFMQITPVAQLPKLLEQEFADLTDVLGGDGVAKYPGLANIPAASWRIPELNGRLWGIPMPRPPVGLVLTTRGDVLKKRGIDDPYVKLRDGADFVDLLKQLTNKDKGEFSMGAQPSLWLLPGLYTMIGGPNNWAVEDGKFVNQLVTEQYQQALAEAAKIIQAGYLHPNSFSEPGSNSAWYIAGTTALYFQGFSGWGSNALLYPEWNVGNIELPKWDGGGSAPIRKSLAGYVDYIAIKKSDDARLDQLLRVVDYQASPFGTQQYLDVIYGLEGYSYDMVDGNPVRADPNPGVVPMAYAGSNRGAVLFGAGERESVDAQHDFLSRAIPAGIDDASWGLYSETETTKGATLVKEQQDVERAVMLGEKPMSDWESFVSKWKTEVGDKSAAEYEDAASQR